MAEGIGLRQLMDWHTFVQSREKIAWREIMPTLERAGLLKIAAVFTEACVLYLGLERPAWHSAEELGYDMMSDILESGDFGYRSKTGWAIRMANKEDRKSKASFMKSAIRTMNRNIRMKHPIVAKVPPLLIFFGLYLPLRYWFRSHRGLRSKRSCRKMIAIAATREKLFRGMNRLTIYTIPR